MSSSHGYKQGQKKAIFHAEQEAPIDFDGSRYQHQEETLGALLQTPWHGPQLGANDDFIIPKTFPGFSSFLRKRGLVAGGNWPPDS